MPLVSPDVPAYEQIRQAFDALPAPAYEHSLSYATAELLGELVRIGKSVTGSPVLIVAVGHPDSMVLPDRHYANLRLRHNRRLRLKGSPDVRRYSVLECFARDLAIQDWFLRLLPSLCHQIGNPPDARSLERQVVRLSELFRTFDARSAGDLAGIWAELYLLSISPGLRAAVKAWHVGAESIHDFTQDGFHIEVKATTGPSRRHQFSLPQLQPPRSVLVASLLLSRADSGVSVLDLYNILVGRLVAEPNLCDKLHRQVMAVVGRRLAEADEMAFDPASAAKGLRYFLADNIPQIRLPLPAGVSRVGFTSDLGSTSPMREDERLSVRLWRDVLVAISAS